MKYLHCMLLLMVVVVDTHDIEQNESILVLTKENFKTTITENDFILVEFYLPSCVSCKIFHPEFVKAAQKLAEKKSFIKLAQIDGTVETSLAEEYKVRSYPTLKFFYNGASIKYDGGPKASDVIDWVIRMSAQLVSNNITLDSVEKSTDNKSLSYIIELNSESASKIFIDLNKSHLLFFISKDAEHVEKYVKPLEEVAATYHNKVDFIIVSLENYPGVFKLFNVFKEEVPTIRLIIFDGGIIKYKPEGQDFSAKAIQNFLQKFMNGELKEHLISQELPEDWDKKPVKILVANNFDGVAFNVEKDVLVDFYDPLNENCKQFDSVFDELGEKYKDHESIVIAKIDATANELKYTIVSTFPSIQLYRQGDNMIIDYNLKQYRLKDLVDFLEAHVQKVPEVSKKQNENHNHSYVKTKQDL